MDNGGGKKWTDDGNLGGWPVDGKTGDQNSRQAHGQQSGGRDPETGNGLVWCSNF